MLGPVQAFRWMAEASEETEPKPTALARIFVVPEGEPADALLTHISGLSQAIRLMTAWIILRCSSRE